MTNSEIFALFMEHYNEQKKLAYAETKRNLLDLICTKYTSLQTGTTSYTEAIPKYKEPLFKAFHNLFTELADYVGKKGLTAEEWKKACELIEWFGELMKDEVGEKQE